MKPRFTKARKPDRELTVSIPTDRETGRGTWDENSSLRLYLKEAVETPLLTPVQEAVLARRIQSGDDEARERMIKANLRLVVKIAHEYKDYGLPLLDLINEGNIGLMRGVERFDPTKGAKLSTYAAWWIKQSIKRALSNHSKNIRLPIHLQQDIARMKRAIIAFEGKNGYPPSDIQLAAILNVDESDIQHWRESSRVDTISLETALSGENEKFHLEEIIPDEQTPAPWQGFSDNTDIVLISELVSSLEGRLQEILSHRFGLNGYPEKTLEEVGVIFGLTRERIRQLQNQALKKLRKRMEARERAATRLMQSQ